MKVKNHYRYFCYWNSRQLQGITELEVNICLPFLALWRLLQLSVVYDVYCVCACPSSRPKALFHSLRIAQWFIKDARRLLVQHPSWSRVHSEIRPGFSGSYMAGSGKSSGMEFAQAHWLTATPLLGCLNDGGKIVCLYPVRTCLVSACSLLAWTPWF